MLYNVRQDTFSAFWVYMTTKPQRRPCPKISEVHDDPTSGYLRVVTSGSYGTVNINGCAKLCRMFVK